MTTTGNGIFVCYDDNQQQQASMPFQYKAVTTTDKHGVVLIMALPVVEF